MVVTMQKATIIKVGNSYGIRINQEYARNHNLKLGDEVELTLRPAQATFELEAFRQTVRRAAEIGGGLQSIPDPAEWQHEMRQDKPLEGREW